MQIVTESTIGFHNSDPDAARRQAKYRDLSTICVIPTRGMIHFRVVQSWMALMAPMNQKFTRFMVQGMEVGAAYSAAIENILAHPELKKWKYILTMEEDNMPSPDSLLKLYDSIEKYDAVGGLYWTKGIGGKPMCYGNPRSIPVDFIPFLPPTDQVAPCRGLGMGFTLFRMELFKDKRLSRPMFRTVQQVIPGKGAACYTQDLKFFEDAGKLGYKFACDTSVKIGHFDSDEEKVW